MVKRLSIFGDSITWGKADTECGGWVSRLNRFYSSLENYEVEIYNVGVSGDTTEHLVSRFDNEAQARNRKEQVFLFAIGLNDSYYVKTKENPNVSVERLKENIGWLIENAQKYTDTFGFIGPTNVNESLMPRKDSEKYYTNDRVEMYSNVIRDVCLEKGIPFLDMLDIIEESELPDGLHPDAGGHEKMFQRIKQFIVKNKIL
ncbi:hypothetical protein H6758_04620 [Candidatus Nomurabacteria bacterium]|nr:hypothetical protein [Candidatus Nomurabacteria bacterium]